MIKAEEKIYEIRQEIFNHFYEATDVHEAVQYALARVGESFQLSRVYIFQDSEDGTHSSNTFEWCGPGITSEKDNLQNVSYEYLGGYRSFFDAQGCFICPSVSKLPSPVREVLESQKIKSMIQYLIFDHGKNWGFVGFDDCTSKHPEWLQDKMLKDTLILVARMLTVFLLKAQDVERLHAYQSLLGEKLQEEQVLRQEAAKANQAKSAFLSNVSHDMRTPLNGILGSVELAKDEIYNPKAMRAYLQDIAFSGNFLLSLINDVLDVTRIEKGEMKLRLEPYPYDDFIRRITNLILPLCQKKHITLNMNPLSSAAAVLVDKIRFQQIFFNIFSNAVKYTPEGGVINHYTQIKELDANHIDCRCSIVDNGIGMSEDFVRRAFEPFVRERQSSYEVEEGTGLGLHIAQELAHLMGGEIILESTLGRGTKVTVHLVLEVVRDYREDLQEKDVREEEKLRNLRILVVEDHPLNAKIVRVMLERAGCRVDWVNNGAKAVEQVKKNHQQTYDVILMDMRMPIMNGVEATRAIRAMTGNYARSVPIIAMTANAFPQDIAECLVAGMNAHLSKPISLQTLYTTILQQL